MSTAQRTGTIPGAASKVDSAREVVSTAVDTLIAQLESGKSEQLLTYLSTMSRFHSYSFGNVMLIMGQRPEATYVAGFHTWKSMGRSVLKGEKGIVIIAPMIFRKNDATETDNEENIVRYRAVHVFDISQTEGDPFPEPVRIGGDPGDALARLESAIRSSGIRLETTDSLGGAHGVSIGGTIKVIDSLCDAERFSVLAHEWAHELLHKVDRDERPSKTVRETEAESVAFVVSHAFSLETRTASSDYIQLYNGDRDTLTSSLDRIQKTACMIIEGIHDQGGHEDLVKPSKHMSDNTSGASPKPVADAPPLTQSETEVHELDPDRFEMGEFCYQRERTVGEGDIVSSYSGDKIALAGTVRNPFTWKGQQWVMTSGRGECVKAYRVVHPDAFQRKVTTYAQKTRVDGGEAARSDPNGFYDGMKVTRGKQEFVLCGPQVILKPGKVPQGELFAQAFLDRQCTR